MLSTLKISSGAQLCHYKRDITAFDTVLFYSNLNSLRRKYLNEVPTDKIVLSSGSKISKRPLKRGHWWLKNKERKCHFRFIERRFLAAIPRKERSCQSFSASHIEPRADCPFHRPVFFRPANHSSRSTVSQQGIAVACVASVSVGFGSKERLSVFCLRGKWGESQKKNGGGRGGEGRNRLRTNPAWILKTPVLWRTGLVIGWAGRTFLTCVDQRS